MIIHINWNIVEPIMAGIAVSLINRFVFNNHQLWACCTKPCHEEHESAEQGVITTTTIEGESSGGSSNPFGGNTPHIHISTH